MVLDRRAGFGAPLNEFRRHCRVALGKEWNFGSEATNPSPVGRGGAQAAFEGNWEEAVTLNLQIIDRFQKDADAFNRLGRAYISLGNLDEAKEAYSKALRADPANLIARRNLQRLEILRGQGGGRPRRVSRPGPMPRTSAFWRRSARPGSTSSSTQANCRCWPTSPRARNSTSPRKTTGSSFGAPTGTALGEVEPKTARRVMDLMASGNRYEIFALGLTGHTLRTIIREIFRDPSVATTVSFPRQITSRAYLRDRDLLRQRDEADFFLFDEEEEEDEAEPLTTRARRRRFR